VLITWSFKIGKKVSASRLLPLLLLLLLLMLLLLLLLLLMMVMMVGLEDSVVGHQR
jgi:hypothetical protein